MFHGVTDDTLARAAALLGDPERRRPAAAPALATYERLGAHGGATGFWPRLGARFPGTTAARAVGALARRPGGLWLVGTDGQPRRFRRSVASAICTTLVSHPDTDIAALDLVRRSRPGDRGRAGTRRPPRRPGRREYRAAARATSSRRSGRPRTGRTRPAGAAVPGAGGPAQRARGSGRAGWSRSPSGLEPREGRVAVRKAIVFAVAPRGRGGPVAGPSPARPRPHRPRVPLRERSRRGAGLGARRMSQPVTQSPHHRGARPRQHGQSVGRQVDPGADRGGNAVGTGEQHAAQRPAQARHLRPHGHHPLGVVEQVQRQPGRRTTRGPGLDERDQDLGVARARAPRPRPARAGDAQARACRSGPAPARSRGAGLVRPAAAATRRPAARPRRRPASAATPVRRRGRREAPPGRAPSSPRPPRGARRRRRPVRPRRCARAGERPWRAAGRAGRGGAPRAPSRSAATPSRPGPARRGACRARDR